MRDFHDRQEDAKVQTEWLVVLMITAGIVTTIAFAALASFATVSLSMLTMSRMVNMTLPADYFSRVFFERFWTFGAGTALIIISTSVYRCWQLSQGGGRILAHELGGTRIVESTTDLNQKKLIHVVEELAIAAGIPTPPIFVLQDDLTINAFAAGQEPKDYVVGVTRGAIDQLSREQLQGVMAHEFSHIINGDTRLNLRLIGLLAGIQVMARMAAFLCRMGAGRTKGTNTALGAGHGNGQSIAMVLGAVIYPVGAIGEFFAQLVKLAVNRQREFLADASAVQLTRNPLALSEALQLIEVAGSRVSHPYATLTNHIFFADVNRNGFEMLDTHPPIAERIRRLDPIGRAASSERSKAAISQSDRPQKKSSAIDSPRRVSTPASP